MEGEMKIFNSFDKSALNLQRGFIIVIVICVVGLGAGYYYMTEQIKLSKDMIVVLDSENTTYVGHRETLSRERRNGQLRRHVEIFLEYFWNVSQDRDNLDMSINKALELADESGLQLYERFYETQGLANWLYENSGQSFIVIEDVFVDMSSYPYEGYVIAYNELETPVGNSRRHLDLKFSLKNYRASYENVAGALITNIEVTNEQTVEADEQKK